MGQANVLFARFSLQSSNIGTKEDVYVSFVSAWQLEYS